MAIDSRITMGLQPLNVGQRFAQNVQNLQQVDLLNQLREQAPFQNQLMQLQAELAQAQQPANLMAAESAASGEQQLVNQQELAKTIATNYATALRPVLGNPQALLSELKRQKQVFQSQGINTAGIDEDIAQAQTPKGLAALSQEVEQALTPISSTVKSVGQREFEAKTKGLTEDQRQLATLIDLGLAPRATGGAAKTVDVGGVPHVFDPVKQTLVPAIIEGKKVTSKTVAESESLIEGEKETAKQVAQNIGKAVGEGLEQGVKAFEKIPLVKTAISNYDEAIAALDAGAETGTIDRMLPSFTEAGKNLDNTIKRLGLDVVGNTTFGALSESELDFALKAAIPDNLQPADLRKWLIAKKEAQQKLLKGLDEMANFLGDGTKTLVDWNNQQAINKFNKQASANPSLPTISAGNVDVPEGSDLSSLTLEQLKAMRGNQ